MKVTMVTGAFSGPLMGACPVVMRVPFLTGAGRAAAFAAAGLSAGAAELVPAAGGFRPFFSSALSTSSWKLLYGLAPVTRVPLMKAVGVLLTRYRLPSAYSALIRCS